MIRLTPGEVRALKTILRAGGNVTLTQGRIPAGSSKVCKAVAQRLIRRGLVRVWNPAAAVEAWHAGPVSVDLALTAEGCRAYHNAAGED